MRADVVCLSHLPWSADLERPRAIMERFARDRRVFFVETTPRPDASARGIVRSEGPAVKVLSFGLPEGLDPLAIDIERRRILAAFARDQSIEAPYVWVYDPLAMPAVQDVTASMLIYDCIDDPHARGAVSARSHMTELALLSRADIVFTASEALFEAKRGRNVSTFPLPSSVDAEHFARGRCLTLGHKRPVAGILGSLDDRLDVDLVMAVTEARPELDVELVGERRIDLTALEKRPNARWVGAIASPDLPSVLQGWDVGLIPWREGDPARLLVPSSALPLIAAGKPVVATRIDELLPLVERGLVREATGPAFVDAVLAALADALDHPHATVQRSTADALLARTSWDRTFNVMLRFIADAERGKRMRANGPGTASRPLP